MFYKYIQIYIWMSLQDVAPVCSDMLCHSEIIIGGSGVFAVIQELQVLL